MKKQISAIFFFTLMSSVFAAQYRIESVDYNITGNTRAYAIDQKVPINKKRIFSDEEELISFMNDYRQQLDNLRAFESIEVDFKVDEPDENEISSVHLEVTAKDSLHFICMPYPSYNSNTGFKLKLRAKDTNFLGSLNTMSGDFNFAAEENQETEKTDWVFGFNLAFDTPFKLGVFNVTWINDYEFSYTLGESTPEWNLKTGLEFSLPFDKFSLNFAFHQSFIRDLDYEDTYINKVPIHYGDGTYFIEEAKISMPISIQEVDGWGKIYYTPYFTTVYNWDFNGINKQNKDLSSPKLTIGQTISTSRVNWINNFRTGIDISLTQSFSYNVQTEEFSPGIKGEFKGYKGFKYAGICTDLYAFAYLNGTEKIGSRLRGIRDDQYFSSESGNSDKYACETPAAIVLNFDLPIHIFTAEWEKVPLIKYIPFAKYFNLELQLSPFVDAAFIHNRSTGTTFNYKDGFYTGGIEAIVYPLKWKGIQIRGSFGVDLGRYLLKGRINQDWRDSVSRYELSIGIGLLY